MKFNERLKQLREQAGFTQEELAKKINLTKANISKYESGKLEPNLETLILIANIFDVSTDYLLGRTDDPDTVILTNKNLPIPDEFKELEIEIEADRKTMPKTITEDMVRQIIEEELIKHGYKLKNKEDTK